VGETDCQNVKITGGKASALRRLAARYPVPPVFALRSGLWMIPFFAHMKNGNKRQTPAFKTQMTLPYSDGIARWQDGRIRHRPYL